MADASIVLAEFPYQQTESRAPLALSTPVGVDYLATSAESTQSELVAPIGRNTILIWIIKPRDGDVWVKFGDNPEASEGSDWFVREGETLELTAMPGQRVAVIDA